MVDTIYGWSTTAADNDDADDEIDWTEGQLPGTVNNSARAMMRRVAQLMSDLKGTITTAGSVNAFTVTSNTTPTLLAQGWIGIIEFDRAPSGASTLTLDSLAAKSLVTLDGAALDADMINIGDQHIVMYDSGSDHYRIMTLNSLSLDTAAIGDSVQAWSAILDATTASFLAAHETKLDYLTVTGAVDLDTIDSRISALDQAVIIMGSWAASGGAFPGSGTAQAGEKWVVSDTGTVDSVEFKAGDTIIATTDNASTTTYAANWVKIDNTESVASETVAGISELATDAETLTGTATDRVVTPANVTAKLTDIVESQADFNTGTATDESTVTAAKLKASIATHETKTFVISGTIGDNMATVVLDQKAQFAYDIESIAYECLTGSFTFDVEIDGVDVTSLAALSCSTTEAETTATGANSVAAGNTVRLVFTTKNDGEDLYFSMKCTRT